MNKLVQGEDRNVVKSVCVGTEKFSDTVKQIEENHEASSDFRRYKRNDNPVIVNFLQPKHVFAYQLPEDTQRVRCDGITTCAKVGDYMVLPVTSDGHDWYYVGRDAFEDFYEPVKEAESEDKGE